MSSPRPGTDEVRDTNWLTALDRLNLLELGNLWWVDEHLWRRVIGGSYDSDRPHHPALCVGQDLSPLDWSSPFVCLYGSHSRRADVFVVRNLTPPVPPASVDETRFGEVCGRLFFELWTWMTRTPPLVYRIPGARTCLDASEKEALRSWLGATFAEGRP